MRGPAAPTLVSQIERLCYFNQLSGNALVDYLLNRRVAHLLKGRGEFADGRPLDSSDTRPVHDAERPQPCRYHTH